MEETGSWCSSFKQSQGSLLHCLFCSLSTGKSHTSQVSSLGKEEPAPRLPLLEASFSFCRFHSFKLLWLQCIVKYVYQKMETVCSWAVLYEIDLVVLDCADVKVLC
eukprot:c17691_g1_i1 orf=175-492(-)